MLMSSHWRQVNKENAMRNHLSGIVLVSLVFCGLISSQASAALWRLDFSGEVSSITEYLGEISSDTRGVYNFHDGRFFLGQTFSGHVLLNGDAVPLSTLAGDPEKDIYAAVIEIEVDLEGLVYQKGGGSPSYAQVWNRAAPNPNKDVLSVSGNTYVRPFEIGEGSNLSSAILSFFDRDGDVFSSTSLEAAIIALSSFDNFSGEFETANFRILHYSTGSDVVDEYVAVDGGISSAAFTEVAVVPVPAAALLFISGLGVIATVIRR